MNKIYFSKNLNRKKLKEELSKVFDKGEEIAIKLHMGEPGNKYYLRPIVVKVYVDILKKIGCKPFLFDSPVVYAGPRNTSEDYLKAAAQHGYTEATMGCPIVISNQSITFKGKDMDHEVCKTLAEADGVLVLTHLKGHFCCGFGGAIKNLGMGAVSKETKGKIHNGGEPEYDKGCTMCKICASKCPLNHIRYENNRPYFDANWCCGCSNCVRFCPENAIKAKVDLFDYLLAEGAHAALSHFKKAYFVNIIKNIAKLCDCNADAGGIVLEDVGVAFGDDIISVDKASLDLINKKAGKDLFEEIHFKSPLAHIKDGAELGMGKLDYELVQV
ncbi:MAG: hypothetical protein MAG795_00086 [Candidatus Woesearchaeota archaeon]|nr:hypothetical protein [Candidatus Woesearchaeota archaeon]